MYKILGSEISITEEGREKEEDDDRAKVRTGSSMEKSCLENTGNVRPNVLGKDQQRDYIHIEKNYVPAKNTLAQSKYELI